MAHAAARPIYTAESGLTRYLSEIKREVLQREGAGCEINTRKRAPARHGVIST